MKRAENLTPGPFTVGPRINASGAHHQIVSLAPADALGNRPATSILASSQDDARKIARALNCFDELLEALIDLLGDLPSIQFGICQHCGRSYDKEDIWAGDCPAEDCVSFKARVALAKAKGGCR